MQATAKIVDFFFLSWGERGIGDWGVGIGDWRGRGAGRWKEGGVDGGILYNSTDAHGADSLKDRKEGSVNQSIYDRKGLYFMAPDRTFVIIQTLRSKTDSDSSNLPTIHRLIHPSIVILILSISRLLNSFQNLPTTNPDPVSITQTTVFSEPH